MNGRELQPRGFHPPQLLSIYERRSGVGETFQEHQKKVIAAANPHRDFFNAYLVGEEQGVYVPKITVTYYKI
jgi:hypothetical protein